MRHCSLLPLFRFIAIVVDFSMHSPEVLMLSINVRQTVIIYWSWFVCKSIV